MTKNGFQGLHKPLMGCHCRFLDIELTASPIDTGVNSYLNCSIQRVTEARWVTLVSWHDRPDNLVRTGPTPRTKDRYRMNITDKTSLALPEGHADWLAQLMEWAHIEALLVAVGAQTIEGDGSRVRFALNNVLGHLPPTAPGEGSQTVPGQGARQFLEQAGVKPGNSP